MKSLSAEIVSALQSDNRFTPILVLNLPDGAGTIALGGSEVAELDNMAIQGRITSWQPFSRSTNWNDSKIRQSVYAVTVSNTKMGSDNETFVEQISSYQVSRIRAELRYYIRSLINATDNYITIFRGYLEHIESYNELECKLEICDGIKHIDIDVGTLINEDLFPTGINEDAIGKMMPIIWGELRVPTICIRKANECKLTEDVTESDTTIYFESDKVTGNDWPSSGTIFVGEELVHYTGKTDTSFTGCTRGYHHTVAKPHYKGATILHWAAAGESSINHQFLVAGHAVKDIDDVKINDFTPPNEDYVVTEQFINSQGWGEEIAFITFSRNPIYPDEEGKTSTKKIYTNKVKSGNSAVNYDDSAMSDGDDITLEGTEGQGVDTSKCCLVKENKKLYIRISDRDWYTAAKSLGKISKVNLILKHRVNFEADWRDKRGTQITELKVRCGGKTTSDWVDLDKPDYTGEDGIEEEYFTYRGEINDIDNSEEDPTKTYPPRYAFDGLKGGDDYNAFSEFFIDDKGQASSTVRFDGMVRKSSLSRMEVSSLTIGVQCATADDLHTFTYSKYWPRNDEHESEGPYRDITLSGGLGSESTPEYESTESSYSYAEMPWIPDQIRLKFTENTTGSGEGFVRMWAQWVKVTAKEVDNSKVTQEIDVTEHFEDWDDLDEAWIEAQMNSTDQDGIWWECYEAYFEVEYWSFKPSSKYEISANVKGRYDDSITKLDGDKTFVHVFINDLLKNWVLPKSPSGYDGGDYFTFGTLDDGSPDLLSDDNMALRVSNQIKMVALIEEISRQGHYQMYFEDLIWRGYYHQTYCSLGASVWDITDGDVIRNSLIIKPGRIGEIYNRTEYNNKFDYVHNTYQSSGIYKSDDSIAKYGTRVAPLDLKIDTYSSTYPSAAIYLINLLREPRDIYSFAVKPEGVKLEVGDVITLTYSLLSISSQKLEVLSVEFVPPNFQANQEPYVNITAIAEQVES